MDRNNGHMQSEQVFKKILVPTDGSLHSLIAQELAAFIAKKLGSKVTVLHVVAHEPMALEERHTHVPIGFSGFPIQRHVSASPGASLPEPVASEIINWYHQKGEKAIAEAVALFKEEGVPVDQKLVEHADPAQTILEEAQKGNYDLIVMGRSGEEEQEPHLGSVAEKVSRHARTPVLVAGEQRQISKILAPVDGSENAEKTLQPAVLLARKTDAKMTLLYVQESGLFNLRSKVAKKIGVRILSNATNQVEGIELDKKLESGDPAKTIIQTANKGDYDIIVIGSRGLGGIGRFLLGSVSDHVIHYANRSVLIIPNAMAKRARKEEISIEKMARHSRGHFPTHERHGVRL
jgi:nucleotide-binding universal stress UspA family protein